MKRKRKKSWETDITCVYLEGLITSGVSGCVRAQVQANDFANEADFQDTQAFLTSEDWRRTIIVIFFFSLFDLVSGQAKRIKTINGHPYMKTGRNDFMKKNDRFREKEFSRIRKRKTTKMDNGACVRVCIECMCVCVRARV